MVASTFDPATTRWFFNGRRLILFLLAGLFGSSMHRSVEAADAIAILNFTARRVDVETVQAFSRNLREALLVDGRFDVIDELAMYDALAGDDGTLKLKQARALLADAKKNYRATKYDDALKSLEEAKNIHRALYSELSRPDELADVLLYQGLTMNKLDRAEVARITFLQMFLLHPSMDVSRIPSLDASTRSLLDDARKLERQTPLKGMNSAFAAQIGERLHASAIMTGVIEAGDGAAAGKTTLTLLVYQPGLSAPKATLIFDLDDISAGVPASSAAIYRRVIGMGSRYLQLQ